MIENYTLVSKISSIYLFKGNRPDLDAWNKPDIRMLSFDALGSFRDENGEINANLNVDFEKEGVEASDFEGRQVMVIASEVLHPIR